MWLKMDIKTKNVIELIARLIVEYMMTGKVKPADFYRVDRLSRGDWNWEEDK